MELAGRVALGIGPCGQDARDQAEYRDAPQANSPHRYNRPPAMVELSSALDKTVSSRAYRFELSVANPRTVLGCTG